MIIRSLLPLVLLLSWPAARGSAQEDGSSGRSPTPAARLVDQEAAEPKSAESAAPAVPAAPAALSAPEKKGPKPSGGGRAPVKNASKSGKKKAPLESKYKSRALSENTETSYRYDADGNPIVGTKKKRSSAEKAEKTGDSEEAEDKAREKCSSGESCSDKPSESDAL